MLFVEEGLSSAHLRSDLESDAISPWLSWVRDALLINVPGLVESIVAVVEDHVSLVGVGSTMHIEALSSEVLNVSVLSSNPLGLLIVLVSPLSDVSNSIDAVFVTSPVRESIASS